MRGDTVFNIWEDYSFQYPKIPAHVLKAQKIKDLLVLIDYTIDKGDKEWFMSLTQQLNEVKK